MTKSAYIMSFFHKKHIRLVLGCTIILICTLLANQAFTKNPSNRNINNLVGQKLSYSTISDEGLVVSQNSASTEKNGSTEVFSTYANSVFMKVPALADEEIVVLSEQTTLIKNLNIKKYNKCYINDYDPVFKKIGKNNSNNIRVEFRKTPLNSVGYKLLSNKLILYGCHDTELILVEINDTLYMKNSTEFFLLDYTTEFKKMVRVSEDQKSNLTNYLKK